MPRQLGSARGTTLLCLLFVGCADSAAESGFGAGPATPTSGATLGVTTTFGASSSSSESSSDSSGTASSTGALDTGGSTSDGGLGGSGGPELGDTHGGTSTGGPMTTGGTTGDDMAGVPGFVADIWPIFDARCSCHKDDNGAGQLRLTLEDAYINLLEPSEQLPMMMLVQPGSSDKSYLWQKLNDTQKDVGGKGKRMPPGGLLDPADLELIRQWLDTGAAP